MYALITSYASNVTIFILYVTSLLIRYLPIRHKPHQARGSLLLTTVFPESNILLGT